MNLGKVQTDRRLDLMAPLARTPELHLVVSCEMAMAVAGAADCQASRRPAGVAEPRACFAPALRGKAMIETDRLPEAA
jgi:hypothetical protein